MLDEDIDYGEELSLLEDGCVAKSLAIVAQVGKIELSPVLFLLYLDRWNLQNVLIQSY